MSANNNQQIQNFRLVGVNYKKTATAERGMYAVSSEQYEQILTNAPQYNVTDIFVVSTCNRTEVYGFAESTEQLAELLCSVTVGDFNTFNTVSYVKNSREAIEHLFQVAAGLDSQILGDFEILGQIKNAVKFSKTHGFINTNLERLINCVYQSAKSIKTNTALSGGTVSVSFAAVQYIKEFYPEIAGKKIVLYGTGKIGRTTCRNLVDYLGTRDITLINRTEETALALAVELNLKSAPVSDLDNQINNADIILVSTGAQEPVIFKNQLVGKGEKLVIDLSVPRNVEEDAKTLPGITLLDVDMLSKIKDETLQKRLAEVPKAKAIIEEHITEYYEWYEMRKYAPVLKEIKNTLKDIYIAPSLLNFNTIPVPEDVDASIKKVMNSLAAKMRQNNSAGCYCIEAINEING